MPAVVAAIPTVVATIMVVVIMVGGTMAGGIMEAEGIGMHQAIRSTHVHLANSGIRTCIRTVSTLIDEMAM